MEHRNTARQITENSQRFAQTRRKGRKQKLELIFAVNSGEGGRNIRREERTSLRGKRRKDGRKVKFLHSSAEAERTTGEFPETPSFWEGGRKDMNAREIRR